MKQHLDFFKQPIQVGDRVAFITGNYRDFMQGTVTKLTPKGVTVSYVYEEGQRDPCSTNRSCNNVIKTPEV